MGTVGRAVREDEGGLPTPARTTTALSVVGWSGGDVPEIHCVELGDVDAELHRRRAVEDRKLTFAEPLLTFQSDGARVVVLLAHVVGVRTKAK